MGRPVVVTGAAGFIGARFVELCNQRDVPVVSVDDPAHFGSRPEHASIEFGEIVAVDDLPARVAEIAPRGIVHMGACTDTTEFDEAFLKRVNPRLLEGAVARGDRAADPVRLREQRGDLRRRGEHGYDDDPTMFGQLQPLNPYGESKLQFDVWAQDEAAAGRQPVAWSGFRFFNVYGFGERHKQRMASVVLQAFDQIRDRGRVKLFRSHKDGVADGEQKRDFIFVDDVVDVLWFALEQPIRSGVFNLGTGEARTFLDLVRATFKALGKDENVEWIDTPADIRERYQYFTQAEMGRLRSAGYDKPFTSLEDGVARYVERLAAQS